MITIIFDCKYYCVLINWAEYDENTEYLGVLCKIQILDREFLNFENSLQWYDG